MSLRSAAIPVCLVGVLLCFSTLSSAGTIGLNWDASAGATGYRVYYGDTPGNYFSTPLYDGSQTQTVINSPSLLHCTTWHFVVTAYNAAGESGYSESVSSWPRPEVTSVSPGSAMQGSQFTMTISGASIDPATVAVIDNPHVILENQTDLQTPCTGIQVLATVEPMGPGVRPAQIGDFTITVENPSGIATNETQAFEVLIDPARFDINQTVNTTDGRLDGLDAAWLSKGFGAQEGDSLYDPDYDFDGDGWVDGVDLAYLGSNFGECWDGSSWKASACD